MDSMESPWTRDGGKTAEEYYGILLVNKTAETSPSLVYYGIIPPLSLW